jgi:hypothetical protein
MQFTYVRRQFIYENVCVSHLSGALNRIKMHSHRSAINQPPVVNALLSALTLNVSVFVCVCGWKICNEKSRPTRGAKQ